MNEEQSFDELSGRIEGVGRLLLAVIAELEDKGLIDQPRFSQMLRSCLPLDQQSNDLMISASKTLRRAVDSIEVARNIRQARGNQ